MLLNIALATLMLLMTTGVHAGGMMLSLFVLKRSSRREEAGLIRKTRFYWVSGIVFFFFLVSVVEVLIWATTYLTLGAIEGFERAFYFSMVTFTTLGYGEIVIDERWRLLASFEAANGIIMFGWTTAIVVASVQRIYLKK
jgi:voltage-gated potassium channel Kch